MGREIRMVPAGWEHPKKTDQNDRRGIGYHPIYDQNFDEALKEWNDGNQLFIEGKHPEQLNGDAEKYEYHSYSDWAGDQPKYEDYRHYKDEDCTHYQMYETVTEGTPVTPVFATLQELENWLVEKGEMHGTKYEHKFSKEAAKGFCKDRWAPSMIYSPETGVVDGVTAAGMDRS